MKFRTLLRRVARTPGMKLQIRNKGHICRVSHQRSARASPFIPSNAMMERHVVVGQAPLGAGITVRGGRESYRALFSSCCGENRLLGCDSFGMLHKEFLVGNTKGIEMLGSVFCCSFLLFPLAGSRQSSAPPPPASPTQSRGDLTFVWTMPALWSLKCSRVAAISISLAPATERELEPVQSSSVIQLTSVNLSLCRAPFGAALRLKIITFIPGKTWTGARVR